MYIHAHTLYTYSPKAPIMLQYINRRTVGFGNLNWFSFNSWQFANKTWIAHIPLLPWRRNKIIPKTVWKPTGNSKVCEQEWKQLKKESPGWPTSIAHLGCLQKSVLSLLNLARIAFSYTGYEVKWCLWSIHNQNAGREQKSSDGQPPRPIPFCTGTNCVSAKEGNH